MIRKILHAFAIVTITLAILTGIALAQADDISLEGLAGHVASIYKRVAAIEESFPNLVERLNITERLLVRHQVDIDDLTDRLTALETAAAAAPAPTQVPTAMQVPTATPVPAATTVPTAGAAAEPMDEAAYRAEVRRILNGENGAVEAMGIYEELVATGEKYRSVRDTPAFNEDLEQAQARVLDAWQTIDLMTPPPHLETFHELLKETLFSCYTSTVEFAKNEPNADVKAKELVNLCTEQANAAGADPAWKDK